MLGPSKHNSSTSRAHRGHRCASTLRRRGLGIGVLATPKLPTLGVLTVLVDGDASESQIEQAAHSRLKRMRRIDGCTRLSVFPCIAIELPTTTHSERGSGATRVRIDRSRVGVAARSLPAGRIGADRRPIRKRLTVTLDRCEDRSTNIDDALSCRRDAPAPGRKASQPAIGRIDLADRQPTPIDAGQTVLLASELNRTPGRLGRQGALAVEAGGVVQHAEGQSAGRIAAVRHSAIESSCEHLRREVAEIPLARQNRRQFVESAAPFQTFFLR